MIIRKTKLTRTLAVAGVAASLLLVSTGCSTSNATSASGGLENSDEDKVINEGDEVITLLSQSPDADEAVIKLFEEANPGYKVKMFTAPGASYQQVVTTQLAGDTAPDVLRTFPGNGSNLSLVQASDKGFLADLSDLDFAKEVPEHLRPVLVNSDDQVVGVPANSSGIGGMYNVTVMEELGLDIPSTWSEVIDFCHAAADADKVAYGLGIKDAWTAQMTSYALAATLAQSDPDFAAKQADGDVTFSDSAWVTVFEKYVEMNDEGCFNENPNGTAFSTVQDAIRKGDTLATVGLSMTVGATLDGAPTGTEIDFAALPATDDPSETRLSTGIGVTLSLNAKAENPDAAKKFLEFVATPEIQSVYAMESDASPALEADDSFEGSQADDVVVDYTSREMTAQWPDQTWPNPKVQQTHFESVQALFAGSMSVADLLESLDKAYQS